ncbi:putative membrane protein [Helicobacter pylori CPY3281]|nr:putative membrane protein [Helicobacter pylori CPY3281]
MLGLKLVGTIVHSLFVSWIVRVFSVASLIVASLTIAFTHFFSL